MEPQKAKTPYCMYCNFLLQCVLANPSFLPRTFCAYTSFLYAHFLFVREKPLDVTVLIAVNATKGEEGQCGGGGGLGRSM